MVVNAILLAKCPNRPRKFPHSPIHHWTQGRTHDFRKRKFQPSGRGCQHTTFSKFPEKCMKSRQIWAIGECAPRAPPTPDPRIVTFKVPLSDIKVNTWKKIQKGVILTAWHTPKNNLYIFIGHLDMAYELTNIDTLRYRMDRVLL